MFDQLNNTYANIIMEFGIVGYSEQDIIKRGTDSETNLPLNLLYSYPHKEKEDVEIIFQMMFPDDDHKIPSPKFFSLTLTNEKGNRTFLYCLKFPEKFALPTEDDKQKKTNSDSTPKTIDFSSLINQSQEKLSHQNLLSISLNSVKFNINPSGSDLEKKYHKKYISYFHEEFNSKIIKMYFNYISSSKIINHTVKDNRPFLIDFLKIITNLLMNEIDFSAMVYLLENEVKWLAENGADLMWNHLYNIGLKAKQITSSTRQSPTGQCSFVCTTMQ